VTTAILPASEPGIVYFGSGEVFWRLCFMCLILMTDLADS
jgi:hypothetical protein